MGSSLPVPGRTASRWVWEYPEQIGVVLLSLLGLGVSFYLTLVRLSHSTPFCGLGDCDKVNSSPYAQMLGVPVASWGLLLYAALLALSLCHFLFKPAPKVAILGLFGFSFFGVLFSAYLTYLELAVINAICMWCVISAITVTGIFVLSLRTIWNAARKT